jgi:hypothetical protein
VGELVGCQNDLVGRLIIHDLHLSALSMRRACVRTFLSSAL